jgi:hypothetical protein
MVSGQLHAPVALPPEERGPGTHWIWSCVGPRVNWDDVEKRKISALPGLESRPFDSPALRQSLYQLSYPGWSWHYPDGRMTDELDRMWKETFVIWSKFYLHICLDGLRKTKIHQLGLPVFRLRFEPNTFRIQVYSFIAKSTSLVYFFNPDIMINK